MKKFLLMLMIFLTFSVGASIQSRQREYYTYRGAEVPKYFVVNAFFQIADTAHKASKDTFYYNILSPLGIPPDSTAAQALALAIEEAKKPAGPAVDLTRYKDDPVLLEKIQSEYLRRKVYDLALIYKTLLTELEANGVPLSALETYLEEEIRPSVSVTASPREGWTIEMAKEFEALISQNR